MSQYKNSSNTNSKLKACGIAAVFAAAGLILDQLTKSLAVTYLAGREPISLIPGVLELKYVENRGAAFGMFQNMQWIFIVFSLVVAVLVIFAYWQIPTGKPETGKRSFMPLRICLVVLLTGAVGNLFDRLRLGYVVDFIYFKLIDFPVFNVADIFVTTSVFLLIVLLIFYYKEEDLDLLLHREKKDNGNVHD